MTVLIIPDKFKGTLTANEAAAAIAAGWRQARPDDVLDLLPMSDGGDGFGEVISALLGAKPQTVQTVDAAHRPCKALWWWEPKSRTAVIESARVIGLAMLPPGRFHPFELDTFGLGEVIHAAIAKGARRTIVGLGGSATNDGGFGLARALGWQFLDGKGKLAKKWTGLPRLAQIRAPRMGGRGKMIIAVDVQNPLLGARGATRVYGPQKGVRPKDFELAERSLRRLVSLVKVQSGRDYSRIPGAGAAGGLGFGLLALLHAQTKPGFELFARLAKLSRRLRAADLVITGEGAVDDSTLMGKGVGQIARRCRDAGVPCIVLAGAVAGRTKLKRRFTQIHALTDFTTVEEAKAKAAFGMEWLAARAAREWV